MKNKILFINVMITLTIGLTACGNTSKKINNTTVAESSLEKNIITEESSIIESQNQEINTEVVENNSIEEIQNNTETMESAITEDMSDGFTEEEALAKVYKLLNAYSEIIASNDETAWNILDRCEKLSPVGHIVPTTKDNIELNPTDNSPNGGWIATQVGINYFYDYVNKGNNYYNFTEYIESHTADEILFAYESKEFLEIKSSIDSNYALFGEAIGVIPYIRQFENIEIVEFIEGENCTHEPVSEIEVEYEAVLSLDGENSGLKVVFDKDGNMLNINTENAYEKFDYIFTFSE